MSESVNDVTSLLNVNNSCSDNLQTLMVPSLVYRQDLDCLHIQLFLFVYRINKCLAKFCILSNILKTNMYLGPSRSTFENIFDNSL